MEVQPGILREERIELEKRRRIHAEEERLRQILLQKKDADLRKFKKLIDLANYWKQAMVLREYIESIIKQPSRTEKQEEFILWAKQKIDWFDPSKNKRDDLLDDNDRDKLIQELKTLPYNFLERRYY